MATVLSIVGTIDFNVSEKKNLKIRVQITLKVQKKKKNEKFLRRINIFLLYKNINNPRNIRARYCSVFFSNLRRQPSMANFKKKSFKTHLIHLTPYCGHPKCPVCPPSFIHTLAPILNIRI